MASYSYKLKDSSDLRHFIMSSEKEYGVQCVILRDCRDHTAQHSNMVKLLLDSRPQSSNKDVAFLQVCSPGKAFELFDHEKYKLILATKAYFKLLEFFQTEWPLVFKRIELDYQALKAKKDWISLNPSISFRGPADIVYRSPLDTTNTFVLDLVITKRIDNGKTNITLMYTDENMGSLHLPPQAMVQLAQSYPALTSLYDYKDQASTKRSRQS
jgi:hypothetical protein